MTTKHSIAQKKRWAKIKKSERSKRMSEIRKIGWSKKSKRARRIEGLRLAGAKKQKLLINNQ